MAGRPLQDDVPIDETVDAQQRPIALSSAGTRRVWKINARLVYVINFLHMTMYTMCLGGIFDIFLYNLSQDKQSLLSEPTAIGMDITPLSPMRVDTHGTFELTFALNPAPNVSFYPSDSSCTRNYTCGTSVLHITDGSGNGDCCRIGNRMPMIMFDNGSTRLIVAMDALGQNESSDIRRYDRLQKCNAKHELPAGAWSNVKLKACGTQDSKGQLSADSRTSDGALVLFVNGSKVCEVPGTKYHQLPQRPGAFVFFGSLQPPLQDPHIAANVRIRDVRYGRPASNLFVGTVNSVQGIISVLMMYPIGWAGDYMNRYRLTRWTVLVGAASALVLLRAVVGGDIAWLYAGVVVFTLYQQSISSTIYAILADNVPRQQRTRAGVNYKTFSALAMSSGPALQLCVILTGYAEDTWSAATFNLMLLPGWALLPLIFATVLALKPVGKKISGLPNVDELVLLAEEDDAAASPSASRCLSEQWLDERVLWFHRRRFVVATSVNSFFILTLLANGMTVRYFSLYFTQILKFSPVSFCVLNAVCRLWIALFAQIAKPLSLVLGRSNVCVIMHLGSAVFTLGIYGGGIFEPSRAVACASYLMRFACLHSRDPLLYSMTMDCVPAHQRSRWAALNSLRTLSFSASAVLGGYLADKCGYEFSFNITVVLLLASTLAFVPSMVYFPKAEGGRRGPECNGVASPRGPSGMMT